MSILAISLSAHVLGAATLYRNPTVNGTHIVFEWAGDLWTVPRAGGVATRLTSGVGMETDPSFSPDGSLVAFTGEYDGNRDVYVVPADGGEPERLTWHPGDDVVAGWTRDGKRILFSSARASYSRFPRLFTVGFDGGLPEQLPLPMGERGSYSPDGTRIAYEPLAQWQPDWKRYRGGQTDKIWLADLSDSSVVEIPRNNSNDHHPMWIGDTVYFLSDRDGAKTLFAYDVASRAVERMIDNDGFDITAADAWSGDDAPAAIVYEQMGSIGLYEVERGTWRNVDIRATADFTTLRPHFMKVGDRLQAASISPSGARAVFQARGEIVTVPADKGDVRNLTNTTGVMELDPAWSPDGQRIAYLSDASGEYALHITDQLGAGEVTKIELPPFFYSEPRWSPDSKKIVLRDKGLRLWVIDVEEGSLVEVDKNPIGFPDGVMEPSWSPDSEWIAYARQIDNRLRAIFLYSVSKGVAHQVTDGLSDARYPVFDAGGKYLYFTASTDIGPQFSFPELSRIAHHVTRSVYAMVLAADQPSPLAPESDEETLKPAAVEDEAAAGTPGPPGAAAEPPEPVRIDLDGLEQRSVALPFEQLDFVGLLAGTAGRLFALERPAVNPGSFTFGPPAYNVHTFDFDTREPKKILEGVMSFDVSADGSKVLYRQGPAWWIKTAAEIATPSPMPLPPGANAATPLRTGEVTVWVDPGAEWAQMYEAAWRGERDFFYDRGLHGLDLGWARETYRVFLDGVAHRSDLTYLFTQMLNELSVGHLFVRGGDEPEADTIPGGLLGCDYAIDSGRYRISKIYNGESWNPKLRAPLTEPGETVAEGEYLLAVDGHELTAEDNVHALLENTADRQVVIRVGPSADGSDARDITVVPVRDEAGLRNRAWIEENRRRVGELSNGRLAYIYVPDTAFGGYTAFNRYFFAQTNKHGAVIDERFNGGGLLSDYIVDYLVRPVLAYAYYREGGKTPIPGGAIYGPKAMLINELAGSGGDALPWFFAKRGVGPLIGKRTWGGLVAAMTMPEFMDGGMATAPDGAIYGLDGEWEVENVGVPPDIEVDFDPALWRQGRDPQLETAVEWLLAELERKPLVTHPLPEFPDYH